MSVGDWTSGIVGSAARERPEVRPGTRVGNNARNWARLAGSIVSLMVVCQKSIDWESIGDGTKFDFLNSHMISREVGAGMRF